MTQSKQIKQIILTLLSDNREHTTKEFNDVLATNGIQLDSSSSLLRNVMFNLKKEFSNLENPRRGVYRLKNSEKTTENNTATLDASVLEIKKAISRYKSFNWYSCSDTELETARAQVRTLLALANTITKELT